MHDDCGVDVSMGDIVGEDSGERCEQCIHR